MNKQAAIFDFDGVIFHSEPLHERAWQQTALEEHKPFSREAFLTGFGVKNERFIREILGWTNLDEEIRRIIELKEAKFHTLLQNEGIEPIEGTVALLERLSLLRIPCAIGSSAVLENIDLVLSHHNHLRSLFSAIVSGEEVLYGKPDPGVFLKAASKLGIEPEKCVVFEDAPAGIEAALTAGMSAVALTTTFPCEKLSLCHPTLLVSSLDSEAIINLFRM